MQYLANILFADLFWLRKITTDPHILACLNIVCPDDKYSILKMYISELTLYINIYIYIYIARNTYR